MSTPTPHQPAPPWQTWTWTPTDLRVGRCAWQASLLAGPQAVYTADHPSLIVIDDDDEPLLKAIAPPLRSMRATCASHNGLPNAPAFPPVLLEVREPRFARTLPALVQKQMDAIELTSVEVLSMRINEPEDLKGGSTLQTLFQLRDQGVARHIGLACHDARQAEWIARHTAVRVLTLPYHLEDQSACFRALDAAKEHGMACLAVGVSPEHAPSIRFALGATAQALPLFSQPPPTGLVPMSRDEVRQHWDQYCLAHKAPATLTRGHPPPSQAPTRESETES